MGEKKGRFEGDLNVPGGSFSRLLLSSSLTLSCDDDVVDEKSLSVVNSPLFSSNTPKMLCFGDFSSKFAPVILNNDATTNLTTTSSSNKRRNGSGKESGSGSGSGSSQHQKTGMKMKKNIPEGGAVVTSSPGHAKARREKLGERINVLQQLVSPYGKTDTASVLYEAMGYIRFLHDQVKVLSVPYLNRLPENGGHAKGKDSMEGLRSRGLCLVPMEYILNLTECNGADFWAPAKCTISQLGP